MNQALRLLLLEDSPIDAELNERELRKAGISFTSLRVESLEGFVSALDNFKPDLILADYHLPGFDGLDALAIAREKYPEIPFIFVTGAMGEERAAISIKQGAIDYIIKDRLARLPLAVQRALEEKTLRLQRRESEEIFRKITESAQDAIIMMGADQRISFWNAAAERIFGYSAAEITGKELHALIVPEVARAGFMQGYPHFQATGEGPVIGKVLELTALRKGGEEFPVELSIAATQLNGQWHAIGILRDISERKHAEKALASSEERYHQLFETMDSGVAIFQPDDNCQTFIFKSINRSSERIDLIRREEVIGHSVEEIFPGIRDMGLLDVFKRVCQGGAAEHASVELYQDGRISGWRENYVYRLETGEVVAVYEDVSERIEREMRIKHLNRVLRTISACNEDLVRARSEEDLLIAVCRNIVDIGGHLLAWVAYPGEAAEGRPIAVAHFGAENVYQSHAELEHDPEHERHCLTVAAMRKQRTASCNRLMDRPECSFDKLQQAGVNSILALPLLNDGILYGVLTVFSATPDAFDADEMELMEELSADLAYGIDALRTTSERDHYVSQFSKAMKNTVTAIARTLEMRDPYTAGHQQRVTALSVSIARAMGLGEEVIEGLYFGAMIHDIGKISVPAEILSKPGALSKMEYMLIQCHPQTGFEIVQGVEFPWPVAKMIAQHHERLDGSGYPNTLKDDEIILEARIIAVADVVEAMSSHRPYRPALGVTAALEEITQGKGSRYDPTVVEACIRVIRTNGMQLPQL